MADLLLVRKDAQSVWIVFAQSVARPDAIATKRRSKPQITCLRYSSLCSQVSFSLLLPTIDALLTTGVEKPSSNEGRLVFRRVRD